MAFLRPYECAPFLFRSVGWCDNFCEASDEISLIGFQAHESLRIVSDGHSLVRLVFSESVSIPNRGKRIKRLDFLTKQLALVGLQ